MTVFKKVLSISNALSKSFTLARHKFSQNRLLLLVLHHCVKAVVTRRCECVNRHWIKTIKPKKYCGFQLRQCRILFGDSNDKPKLFCLVHASLLSLTYDLPLAVSSYAGSP